MDIIGHVATTLSPYHIVAATLDPLACPSRSDQRGFQNRSLRRPENSKKNAALGPMALPNRTAQPRI